MHREELVVLVRTEKVIFRESELPTHEGREDSAEEKEDKGGDHEAQADGGVVNFGEPSPDAWRVAPNLTQTIFLFGLGRKCLS